MEKIVYLSDNMPSYPYPTLALAGREVLVLPYTLHGRATLGLIRRLAPDMLVTDCRKLPAEPVLPCPVSNGSLLRLALLPRMLDSRCPGWQDRTISIDCGKKGGILAACLLAEESSFLLLTGKNAPETCRLIFRRNGCILRQNNEPLPLAAISLPRTVNTCRGKLPLCLAEGFLRLIRPIFPTPKGLMAMARLAADHGISV